MANPKGNPQNLTKPGDGKHHEFTDEERRKGGANSHDEYRLKKLLEKYSAMTPDVPEILAKMRKFGDADELLTNEKAIAMRIVIGARNGDPKMIDRYMEATGQKIQRNINENRNIEYKPLVDLTKRNKNGGEK